MKRVFLILGLLLTLFGAAVSYLPSERDTVSASAGSAVGDAEVYAGYEGGFGFSDGAESDSRLDAILKREEERWRALNEHGKNPEKAPHDGETEKKKFIRWCEFAVPYEILAKAMSLDIESHTNGGTPIDWIDLLSLYAVKCYGNFGNSSVKDLRTLAADIKSGNVPERLKNHKLYPFYKEVYTAVLGEYLGSYTVEKPDPENPEKTIKIEKYGMKVYSPIAAGYRYSHYDDFGNSRNFGYKRRHLGHDLMGSIGTPIVAVEGGIVSEIGWNRFGGWRIGIRSFDTKRYYYYAHLRKDKPYPAEFKKGDVVHAGDVIGYLGMTGYSSKPNVNNIKPPHLHFGLQLIFDESQANGASEIWVDVYALTRLLQKNCAKVR
ncbi:MAG: M23 family metallopeptidase [Clostridiales bacterium]|jgi:murein DD-endopeptidase MepM/ murein hydrolase activator NlpD|nr:M23 family metallopeptidase [Clostridiales bacterium]